MKKIITPDYSVGYREVLASKYLIYQLAKRDFDVRYRKTSLGLIWAIINPAYNMALYFFVFGILIRIETPDYNAPYSLVLITGLVIWGLFVSVFTQSSDSILNNIHIIKKINVPALSLAIANLTVSIVDFFLVMLLLLAMIFFYGSELYILRLSFIFYPIFLLLCFSFGIGLIFSILKVKYRDIRHIVPLLVQSLFFLSPIVYTPSLVPDSYLNLYFVNPIAGIVEMFRWCLIGGEFNYVYLLNSTLISFMALIMGYLFLSKNEKNVVDFE